jgi:hypothetical protein
MRGCGLFPEDGFARCQELCLHRSVAFEELPHGFLWGEICWVSRC